jgi:ATP synthase F1 gamma subunit
MNNINDIKQYLSDLSSMKNLTSTFEQVASIRMNQIRDQVVIRKEFFSDVWGIYSNLKLLDRNYETIKSDRFAIIIVCSSYGLIGNMNNQIIDLAKKDITDKSDIFIIGEKGKAILDLRKVPYKKSYIFEDDITDDFVSIILSDIKNYGDIRVFYEEFQSISVQTPKKIYLNFSSYKEKFNKVNYKDYLFEPSYKEILRYLESIMVSMMFTQILYESHLSQYASRMVIMNESSQKASGKLNNARIDYNRIKRQLSDNAMKLIFTNFLKNGTKV